MLMVRHIERLIDLGKKDLMKFQTYNGTGEE